VGYEGQQAAFRIFVPELKRVFISRDVTFMETLIRPVAQYPDESSVTEVSNEVDESESSSDKEAETSTSTSDSGDEIENVTHQERSIADSRPRRERQKPKRYKDNSMLAFIITHELTHHSADVLPTTIDDALRSEAKEKWLHAVEDEMYVLVKNRVFEVQDLPPGRRLSSASGYLIPRWMRTGMLSDTRRDSLRKDLRRKSVRLVTHEREDVG